MPAEFPCALCGRLHDTRRGRAQHQRHCKGAEPAFACASCGVAFECKKSLANHQRLCRGGTGNESATQNEPGDMLCDDEREGNGDGGPVDTRPSIGAYMALLDQQGTLDSAHIVRHRAPRRSNQPGRAGRHTIFAGNGDRRGVLAQAGGVAPSTRSLTRPQGGNATAGIQ